MFVVLVCGGRNYSDSNSLYWHLDRADEMFPFDTLIHGGARGADTLAGLWGIAHNKIILVFKADWERDGKRAGPIRNKRMLVEGKPNMVIAFPGGAGTDNMIRQSLAAGIRTYAVLR